MKILTLIVFIAFLIVFVSGCSKQVEPLSLEAKAQEIENSIMCPICPGETIAQSQSALSQQMRSVVREKLALGATKEEIFQFFAERYGEGVLAAPPKAGFNLLLWILPFFGIGGGVFLVFWIIYNMRRKALSNKTSAVVISDQERQYWEERIREDMSKEKH